MRICLQDPCSVTLDCRGSCIITQTSWQPRKKDLQKRPSFSSRPRAPSQVACVNWEWED